MNKNILIAGGTSGIGAATLQLLLEETHDVYCACRSPEKLPGNSRVHGIKFDATQPSSQLHLPRQLEGFVYFPGTITLKPFSKLTEKDFLRDYQVNFLGAASLLQKALPALLKAKHASVVLFSSVAAQTGLPYHASIAAAKGAVEGMTRSLAAELAPRVRVNCIAPSLTDTPLAAPLVSSDDKREASANRHPLNRLGDPAEVALLVQLLISGGSGFMTGNVLRPDGGLSSLKLL